MARFSKAPVTFRARNQIFKSKYNERIIAQVLASKLLHFVSLTDSFTTLDAKLTNSIFNVNWDSLPGPLIIGTFEKRAPAVRLKRTTK